MMNLSGEVHDALHTIKLLNKESEESFNARKSLPSHDLRIRSKSDDLVDISKINFGDDETWLYESPIKNSNIKDLKAWLYQDSSVSKDIDFHTKRLSLIRELAQIDTKKSIDSRTFTRPKKRISRPSIEQCNESFLKMDKSNRSLDNKYLDGLGSNTVEFSENAGEEPAHNETTLFESCENLEADLSSQSQTPLNFDFSQPTTSSIFDKIITSAPEVDSFLNMSPPSLVNSMCSSTFANLMENSYIKNDPTLREIRDAELTEAMLQDYDPPAFKSFTDSCSSIGSDTTEGFLKRGSDATFNKINKKNMLKDKEHSLNDTHSSNEDTTVIMNCTYLKDSLSDVGSTDTETSPQHQTKLAGSDPALTNNSSPILNGTYRKNPKLNDTFKKPRCQSSEQIDDLNRTVTIVDGVDSNRLLNSPKRHSYIIDNRKCDTNSANLKRNSVGYSVGSTDSLDYMSSLSSSSKGSNKMLNMAEVDAIVLQQEQSLQVMSTPKSSSKIITKLWENNRISPIALLDRGDQLSDSEASSNDDYLTVGSVGSSTCNMVAPFGSEMHVTKSNKSLENFHVNREIPKPNPRSLNAIPAKTVSNKKYDNLRGSYSNLKTVGTNLKGSYSNLRTANSNVKGSYSNLAMASNNMKGSYSNLKTMSNNLKGSYTQLKPVLTNLPCADTNLKVFNPNATTTISKGAPNPHLKKGSDGSLKIAEVAPTLRDVSPKGQVKSASAGNYVKPQLKASGLPRPVSAIPRPMTSRIPAPQSNRLASQPQRYMTRPVNSFDEVAYSSTFEDDEETDNQATEDSSKRKSKTNLNQFNEIQKNVQELLSDSDSTSSKDSFSSAELNEDEGEIQYDEDSDPEMSLVLNALEKSVDTPGVKRHNKTFTEDKIRDIERTNSILMKRILTHNRRANRFTPTPKNKKISSSALNRKKQQKQIDHDNLILLRKIQTVKPFVVNR